MDFVQLFDYDAWANREAVRSLDAAVNPPSRALAVMAHIIGAEWLWWTRLHRSAPRLAVWPALTIAQCGAEVSELGPQWREYVARRGAAENTEAVPYVNSRGESFSSSVGDILFHVITHSAYHRGQIAMALRASGHEPAYTDFIHARRQGLIA